MCLNANYAINVQLVIAIQEIGGGGSETDVVLSSLNLPNSNVFKHNLFYKIEDKLGEIIENLHNNQWEMLWQREYVCN